MQNRWGCEEPRLHHPVVVVVGRYLSRSGAQADGDFRRVVWQQRQPTCRRRGVVAAGSLTYDSVYGYT
jgi:hypothetical protein